MKVSITLKLLVFFTAVGLVAYYLYTHNMLTSVN